MNLQEFKSKLDIALSKKDIDQEKYDHLVEWIAIINN